MFSGWADWSVAHEFTPTNQALVGDAFDSQEHVKFCKLLHNSCSEFEKSIPDT